MTQAHTALADDALAAVVAPDTQRQAAHMAQDAFAEVFRLSFSPDDATRHAGVAALETRLRNWSAAGGGDEARCLRLALLVSGMDQWGIAYSQAFGLVAIPALSELLGALRTALSVQNDARFGRYFATIDAVETDAIDFKVDLRRGIHLALWHAMIACEERDEAARILDTLCGLMLALLKLMPAVGWRLLADALAHIQIRCLADGLASSGVAQETTQGLFEALNLALPKETRERVFAHSTQAVLAWQQARRQSH